MNSISIIPIKVRYISPTASEGSRVRIEVPKLRVSGTIPYRYNSRGSEDTAILWLKEKGIRSVKHECDNRETILVTSSAYVNRILKAFGKEKVK